jgi:tetratricopeptide (TPR) repeat protein
VFYERIGDVEVAQGNLTEALKSFRDGHIIRKRLAKADPNNAGWQRDLAVSYDRFGNVQMTQGDLTEALKSFRDGLAIRERLAKADPNNAGWQRDLQYSVGRIGSLAYSFVLAHDFASALEAADQAISLAPNAIWFYTNRAHALMFLGRMDEARSLYLQYRGEKNVQDEKSWETCVLGDFAELRKGGLTHPLMDEIEAKFTARG